MLLSTVIIYLGFLELTRASVAVVDTSTNETLQFAAYNGIIRWTGASLDLTETALMPLIPLNLPDIAGFDLCDEDSYTAGALDAALDSWFAVRNQDLYDSETDFETAADEETDWIAFYDFDDVLAACEGLIPIHLFYSAYGALAVQNLGASGMMLGGDQLLGACIPPDVDVNSRIVKGVEVVMPSFVLDNEKNILHLRQLLKDGHALAVSVADHDLNPFDDLFLTFSPFRIQMFLLSLWSLAISVFAVKHVTVVVDHYKAGRRDRAGKMALTMRLLILVPEFIAGIVGVLVCFDFNGRFSVFDFIFGRTLLSLRGSIVAFTDVVVVFYCYDVYKAFESSVRHEVFTPFLVKYKFGLPLIIGLGISLISADTIVTQLSLRGLLGSTSAVGSGAFMIALYVGGIVALSIVSFQVRAVTKVFDADAIAAVAGLGPMIASTVLLRKYMFFCSITRVMSILGILAIASGFIYESPAAYGTTMVFMMTGSMASSTLQLLIAYEITPTTSARARGAARVSAEAEAAAAPAVTVVER